MRATATIFIEVKKFTIVNFTETPEWPIIFNGNNCLSGWRVKEELFKCT